MAGIAEVIAGAVRGIVEGGLSFANKSDQERTKRTVQYNETRQKNTIQRNLPLIFLLVIVAVVLVVWIVKRK